MVEFGPDRLELRSGDDVSVRRFVDIRELAWGGSGEYSLLRVILTNGERREIVAGLATTSRGVGKSLPLLPRVILTRLDHGGLVVRPMRSSGKAQQLQRFIREESALVTLERCRRRAMLLRVRSTVVSRGRPRQSMSHFLWRHVVFYVVPREAYNIKRDMVVSWTDGQNPSTLFGRKPVHPELGRAGKEKGRGSNLRKS